MYRRKKEGVKFFSGFTDSFCVYSITFPRSHESIIMPEQPNIDAEGLRDGVLVWLMRSKCADWSAGRSKALLASVFLLRQTSKCTVVGLARSPLTVARIFSPANEPQLFWEHDVL